MGLESRSPGYRPPGCTGCSLAIAEMAMIVAPVSPLVHFAVDTIAKENNREAPFGWGSYAASAVIREVGRCIMAVGLYQASHDPVLASAAYVAVGAFCALSDGYTINAAFDDSTP